jgi:hypothetical protein
MTCAPPVDRNLADAAIEELSGRLYRVTASHPPSSGQEEIHRFRRLTQI